MRLLLLLGALAILSFDVALAGNIGFDLPRYWHFNKDGDRNVTFAELGKTVSAFGTRLAQEAGDILSYNYGRTHNTDREEYRLRRVLLQQAIPRELIELMQNFLDNFKGNVAKLRQFFESPPSPVIEMGKEGIAETVTMYPDNLRVRDRMEALTLLMKDPELVKELEDPYISEVVYAIFRNSSNIKSFQDDPKVMGLLQRLKSKYQRNRYVSDLLDRIESGQCAYCDE